MFVVTLRNRKHSAWSTKGQAEHQKRILEEYGYKTVNVKYLPLQATNGHCFI